MKIVATKSKTKQTGESEFTTYHESKVFDIDSTIKDIMFWANTDHISEIQFSKCEE